MKIKNSDLINLFCLHPGEIINENKWVDVRQVWAGLSDPDLVMTLLVLGLSDSQLMSHCLSNLIVSSPTGRK